MIYQIRVYYLKREKVRLCDIKICNIEICDVENIVAKKNVHISLIYLEREKVRQ